MKGLVTTYRVLAFVVGILLAFCALVALPLKYLATEGSALQQFGEAASIMWLFHGWIFMVYVVVAFLLSRKAGWSIAFTILALVAGLVPLLIFWVERRVVQKLKAENPELEPVLTTAFVLGGGGVLGAVEVGMLRALLEREVVPDLVLGTSIGAFNGAMLASQPDLGVVERLTDLWQSAGNGGKDVYGDRPLRTVRRAVASGTHLWSAEPLRQRLADELGDVTFEELPVALPGLRGEHRAGGRALVQQRSGRGRGDGERRRAGAAATRQGRRRALPRRRHRELDPARPRGRARRHTGVRAPGGPVRPAAQAAEATLAGGARLLRDRAPAPVRPRAGRALGQRRVPRAAGPRYVAP